MKCFSPIDGSVYVERPQASDATIESALEGAAAAQKRWRAIPVAARAAICRRMTGWCMQRADRLGEELTRQMGRPIAYSPNEIRRGFLERALAGPNVKSGLRNLTKAILGREYRVVEDGSAIAGLTREAEVAQELRELLIELVAD